MNVLSLFDGMSCGRIALERAGIKANNYFSSEIDKYAIQIANKNYPQDTVNRLGDVTKVSGKNLPQIDLLIGGSPCQGFSFAGKQLNFIDPRSRLFFEFVRLLEECKPRYFLLENVKMKKEYQDVISKYLGVEPIKINSALVSAQNRERLYWTNIPNIEQPEDLGILLKDILEDFADAKYYLSEKATKYIKDDTRLKKKLTSINGDKSICLMSQYDQSKNGTFLCIDGNGRIDENKTGTLTSRYYKGTENYGSNPFIVELRPCEPKDFNENSICHHAANATDIKGNECIKRVYADSGKAPTLTTMGGGHREPKILIDKVCNVNPSGNGMNGNVFGIDAKCPTLTTNKGEGIKITEDRLYYRKLTPIECERLQTVPDNYTDGVSNSQRYKMLGNGWTIDVIAHIFKGIKSETEKVQEL